MPYIILFLLFFTNTLWTQETDQDSDFESGLSTERNIAQNYRPGLNFQSTDLNTQGSSANLIDSAAVTSEFTEVGRIGALRVDGASTPPILGLDGFIIKDPSISQGQILLDLLPYDFATRVDIYKQNLVPFGVNAGSLIDFRIPINYEDSISILATGSTTGSLYTKIQGEKTFKDGSTFFGILGDIGFIDYYYAIDNGNDFEVYPNSSFERFSFLSKTVWKNLEFIIANTFTDSYSETGTGVIPLDELTRNNFIMGLRYNYKIMTFSANYTLYNHLVQSDSTTNDYLNHQFNVSLGAKDKIDRFYYNVAFGYEYNNVEDGSRASKDNYLGVPVNGEHFVSLVTEFGVSIYKEEENRPINLDFNFSLNQILAQTGLYTPVPSFTLGLRHKNGFYSSAHISRVYIVPDITTAYGFGTTAPLPNSQVLPKDGLRTGLEIGVNQAKGRFYTSFSYSWLKRSFRLTDDNVLVNSESVTDVSAEIGGEYKHLINTTILTAHTALAWHWGIDKDGFSSSTIPMWKWTAKLSARSMDDIWLASLSYRLHAMVPNQGYIVDEVPRHYLDLNFRYKIFIFNVLNLANQSYRPIPENLYSPYNAGIRAELGIEYKF